MGWSYQHYIVSWRNTTLNHFGAKFFPKNIFQTSKTNKQI